MGLWGPGLAVVAALVERKRVVLPVALPTTY